MSAVKLHLIKCDRCGYIGEDSEAASAAAARREVMADGWTRPMAVPGRCQMRIDVCPTCSEKP